MSQHCIHNDEKKKHKIQRFEFVQHTVVEYNTSPLTYDGFSNIYIFIFIF